MKHCDKCKIDVRGEFERCPLCQNKLTGESKPYEFPKVQSFYEKYEKIFKFAILVTSSLSIISIAVNILLPQSGHWSDRKSTRLNSSHMSESRMPSSA